MGFKRLWEWLWPEHTEHKYRLLAFRFQNVQKKRIFKKKTDTISTYVYHRSYGFLFWRVWKRKDFFRTVGTVFLRLGWGHQKLRHILQGAWNSFVVVHVYMHLVLVSSALLFWEVYASPFYMAFYQAKTKQQQRFASFREVQRVQS